MLNVLLADADDGSRECLACYLRAAGQRCITASTIPQARSILARKRVDIVILEVSFPHNGGFDLCRSLREQAGPPVILVSASGEEVDRIVGLELGADDFVVRPCSHRELLARINAVVRRMRALPPDFTPPGEVALRFDVWTLQVSRRCLVRSEGQVVPLRASEYRLLLALLERPHVVFTREQLLSLSWTQADEVFDRAIDTQISRLRKKIEQQPRVPQIIKTVWGVGYVLSAQVTRVCRAQP